jgi:hypothetical protein
LLSAGVAESRLAAILPNGIEGKPADPGIQSAPIRIEFIGVPKHFQCAGLGKVVDIAIQRTLEALQDRPWAEEVAAGARQRALGEHTAMHRMPALLPAVTGPA